MDAVDLPALLARCWTDWAERLGRLTPEELRTPSRCERWTVHAVAAHVAPDADVLALLPTLVLPDAEPAVADAAALLRGYNEPAGVAETMAGTVATAAVEAAERIDPAGLAQRFRAAADFVAATPLDPDAVVPHPVVGTTTVAVLTDVSLVEAVVHLLDVIAAVGGPPPPAAALDHVRHLVARIADPVALIEAATGRTDPGTCLPVLR